MIQEKRCKHLTVARL